MRITRRELKRLIEAFVAGTDGSVTVPTTAQQKGQGLPKSVKLETRIASLLTVGLNAVSNHMFQIYKGRDPEKMRKLSMLMNSPEEENQVMAIGLADTIGLFDEDVAILKRVAIGDIQAAPDYSTLIGDIANYLKGTRSDSLFQSDYRNRSQDFSPKGYIDMTIEKCLERYFRLFEQYQTQGKIKPDRSYYNPLDGINALEYLGLDYLITGTPSTVSPNSRIIYNMMRFVFNEDRISGGVAQQKLSDPRQAYIEGDDPFVIIKFTVYCEYEGSEDADEYLMKQIDDNYSVFVSLEPETYTANYASGPEELTYYVITVSGRLSEFEVTSVDEIESSWMDKQMYEADDDYSSGGFNRPCNMRISEYEEMVVYNNIKELGEIIMKVARKMNYGPAQVENLRKLITTDQTSNDYYREELGILMATYSDMLGFTKDLADAISDETGVTLDEVINPEDYR